MPIKPKARKATYHKPPRFTPAEYTILLQAMEFTAWIKPEGYSDFKSALKKLNNYAATLP